MTPIGGSGGQLGRSLRWFKLSYQRLLIRLQNTSTFEIDGQLQDSDLEENQHHITKDSDVHDEERFVLEQKSSLLASSPVLVSNLWKIYPNGSMLSSLTQRISSFCHFNNDTSSSSSKSAKVAVRGLTFAIRQGGETLGLLGVNGVSVFSSICLYFILSCICLKYFPVFHLGWKINHNGCAHWGCECN